MILAIDPGKDKCGIAIIDGNCQVIEKKVVSSRKIREMVFKFIQKYVITKLVLGNGTTSSKIEKELNVLKVEIKIIDEKNSTLEAEKLYWQENPPRGWRKLLPTSLQRPPRAVDDYAAVVLALRFLEFN